MVVRSKTSILFAFVGYAGAVLRYGFTRRKNCDNANVNASRLANAGGNWNNGSNAGAFHLNVNQSASNTNTNIGARLNDFINP